MTGSVLLAALCAATLLASACGANLSLKRQVQTNYPACTAASNPFPNPNDCSTYYQCTGNAVVAVMPCPSGLHFSAQSGVCDYPQNAKCKVSSSGNNASGSKPAGTSNTSPSECPYPADPNVVVQFPNPEDCGSFYKCGLDGKPVLISCPDGLEWNEAADYCDYPQNAKCEVSSSGNSASGIKPAGTSNTSPSECPYPADPNVVVQFPNPEDCGSFFKCGLDGKPVLISCPDGLEWNEAADYCDYPQNAKCEVSSSDNSASDSKPAGTSNTSPSECPYPADPNVVVQYPNPEDCGSFYKCGLDGKPVLISCPDGLEWNEAADVCDYPASAGCTVSSDNSASDSNPAGTSNTSPPDCPSPAGPNVVHLPNPEDCSSFYNCGVDGKRVLVSCPQSLEWNAAENICDYPESAGCSVSRK